MNDQIQHHIKLLYAIVADLEAMFPGRKFTPDGHLVGSLGEVIAAERYCLTLLPPSYEGHDAVGADGTLVQIKATQVKSVALRSEPQRLIVLKIEHDGTATEIYDGPGKPVWEAAGKMQKNGQRPISLSKLQILSDK